VQAAGSYFVYLPYWVKNFPPIGTRPPTAVYGRVLLNGVMTDPPSDRPIEECLRSITMVVPLLIYTGSELEMKKIRAVTMV